MDFILLCIIILFVLIINLYVNKNKKNLTLSKSNYFTRKIVLNIMIPREELDNKNYSNYTI